MTFSWTGRRLDSITGLADGTASYTYDSAGIRTTKTQNGVKIEYLTSGSTIYGERRINASTGAEIARQYYLFGNGGELVGLWYNNAYYFYVKNVQGDITGIVDSNGNLVVEYQYDEWGKILSTTGSLKDTLGKDNPFRYRGYYYDVESGLYYLQSRYYDPTIRRFVNADSLLSTGQGLTGTNMFAYCLNDPVNFIDSTGSVATEAALFVGVLLLMVVGMTSIGITGIGMNQQISSLNFNLNISLSSGVSYLIPAPALKVDYVRRYIEGTSALKIEEEAAKAANNIIPFPEPPPRLRLSPDVAPKPRYNKPDAKFFPAFLMKPGIEVRIEAMMDANEARAHVMAGGNIWTLSEVDARAFCKWVSNGFENGCYERNVCLGIDAMHYHLNGRLYKGAHIFWGWQGVTFI